MKYVKDGDKDESIKSLTF